MTLAVAVSCQGVSKSFALIDAGNAWKVVFGRRRSVPVFKALEDVSFEVPKGQFAGVLGRNGAGKSTLLRVIGGVYLPDRGRISIEGNLSSLYELGVVGNPELTGRQYADRILKINGFSAAEREEQMFDIHDFSELGDRFEDPVLTYSAGMGARLYFSVATAGRYSVYLLDEILSVGDLHFQAKCWRRLRERVSAGASGVLVTHDWAAIVKLCETAYVLERGKVIFSGPAERAARFYLYGEGVQEKYKAGIAKLLSRPSYPVRIDAGSDFHMDCEAQILELAEVKVVMTIERLQPGYGWEVALMSRDATMVGSKPGRYEVMVSIPRIPLEPGSYQINLHLVIADPDSPGRRTVVDGFGWLSGSGLPLEVIGTAECGFMLPATWSMAAP